MEAGQVRINPPGGGTWHPGGNGRPSGSGGIGDGGRPPSMAPGSAAPRQMAVIGSIRSAQVAPRTEPEIKDLETFPLVLTTSVIFLASRGEGLL